MELTREELLLTSFELDKNSGTKEDYLRAKDNIEKWNKRLSRFADVFKTYCKVKNKHLTKEVSEILKKEDEESIKRYKKTYVCLSRQEHIDIMDFLEQKLKEEIGKEQIYKINNTSKAIFCSLYLKDRAFIQKEQLYTNRK